MRKSGVHVSKTNSFSSSIWPYSPHCLHGSITIKNKQLTTFLSDDDDDDDDYHEGSICSFCAHCEVGYISLMKWTMSLVYFCPHSACLTSTSLTLNLVLISHWSLPSALRQLWRVPM